jgi:hypothetical protein
MHWHEGWFTAAAGPAAGSAAGSSRKPRRVPADTHSIEAATGCKKCPVHPGRWCAAHAEYFSRPTQLNSCTMMDHAEPPVFWNRADLRPSLSPYGQTQVHTPNIQKLADNGTVFLRAYCQEAVRYMRAVSRSLLASVSAIQFLMGNCRLCRANRSALRAAIVFSVRAQRSHADLIS